MKFYKQLLLGLVLAPCYFAIETFAMDDTPNNEENSFLSEYEYGSDEGKNSFNLEYFKQIVKDCTWLSNEDKAVFSSLPEISLFQKKRSEFYEESKNRHEQWDSKYGYDHYKNLDKIKDLAKGFFAKHLEINVDLLNKKFDPYASDKLNLNEVLYKVADKVITGGYYAPAAHFNDRADSELESFSKYSFSLLTINQLTKHIVKHRYKERDEIINDLYNILRVYESHYIYRQEHLERVKLGKRYKEYVNRWGDEYCIQNESDIYARVIRDELKDRLYKFYGEYIDENYLNNPGYVSSDDIYKDINKILVNLNNDSLFKVRASLNQEYINNFSNSRRIKASYFTDLDLLPITVHEAGHAVGDAYILAKRIENGARAENIEAIAMYFEILQYKDEAYKEYTIPKVDWLSSLYYDFTNVVGANMLLNKIPDNMRKIMNLKNLTDKEQEKYVHEHRELCEKVLSILRSMWHTISPKFQESGSKQYENEVYELSDIELADKLSRFGESFTVDPKTEEISFQFEGHNKALFHVFKVMQQAKEKGWNLEQILSELACTKMQTPSPEEGQKIINWLLS